MSNAQTQDEEAFSRYASVLRPGLFAGEVHWVTGGGGIGRCVAHELAALGATVILTGRTEEKLQRVAPEIAQDGGRADTAAFDIRDEEAVRSAVQAMVATHGRINGLINNAGGQFPSPLMAIGKKGFETVLANSLTGWPVRRWSRRPSARTSTRKRWAAPRPTPASPASASTSARAMPKRLPWRAKSWTN